MSSSQSSNIEGSHNIVVQVAGDNNSVAVGVAHLVLVPAASRVPEARSFRGARSTCSIPIDNRLKWSGGRGHGGPLEMAAFRAARFDPGADRARGSGEDAPGHRSDESAGRRCRLAGRICRR